MDFYGSENTAQRHCHDIVTVGVEFGDLEIGQ